MWVTGHLVTGHLVTGHLVTGHLVTGHLVTGHLVTGHLVTDHLVTGHLLTIGPIQNEFRPSPVHQLSGVIRVQRYVVNPVHLGHGHRQATVEQQASFVPKWEQWAGVDRGSVDEVLSQVVLGERRLPTRAVRHVECGHIYNTGRQLDGVDTTSYSLPIQTRIGVGNFVTIPLNNGPASSIRCDNLPFTSIYTRLLTTIQTYNTSSTGFLSDTS